MRDLYPNHGKKQKVASIDDALNKVRGIYPNAYMEGSAGLGRHFFIRDETGKALVVGCVWSSGIRNFYSRLTWWCRVFDKPELM